MQSHGRKGLGWEKSTVRLQGEPYLTRWFLRIGGWTIRLHRFHRGDDARAPHDHPWDFWTFPLCRGYHEVIGDNMRLRFVRGWRPHFRLAEFKHIVLDRSPFYTVVVTKPQRRQWGFWPAGRFIPAKEWR